VFNSFLPPFLVKPMSRGSVFYISLDVSPRKGRHFLSWRQHVKNSSTVESAAVTFHIEMCILNRWRPLSC